MVLAASSGPQASEHSDKIGRYLNGRDLKFGRVRQVGRRCRGSVGLRLLKVNEGCARCSRRRSPPSRSAHRICHRDRRPHVADLRHAKVFVSVLGDEGTRALADRPARRPRPQQEPSAPKCGTATPQLLFLYDESIDRGLRIETLLKRYEGELGPDDAEGEPPAARRRRGGAGGRRRPRTGRRPTPRAARCGPATTTMEIRGPRDDRPARELEAVCAAMRGESQVALAVHESPDGDAVGLPPACSISSSSSASTRPSTSTPASCCPSPASSARRAGRRGDAARPATLYALMRLRRPSGRDARRPPGARSTSTTTTTTRASATSTSSSGGRQHLRARLRDRRTAGPGFSPSAAAALYAGISFDTGHFQHASTSAATFALLRPPRGRRRRPEPRLPAAVRDTLPGLAAALGAGHRQGAAGRAGRALLALLSADDFAATGATDDETEGIVDALRSVPGVEVAALVAAARRRPGQGEPALRGLRRERRRRPQGRRRSPAGGRLHHRKARSRGDGVAQYRTRRAPLDGVLLIDKPAGCTSHDVVAKVRACSGGRT